MVAMSSSANNSTTVTKTLRGTKIKPTSTSRKSKNKPVFRKPNIRGIETRSRELFAPLVQDINIGKVITLLDKLLIEYRAMEKEHQATRIIEKAEAKHRMITLRASYKLSKL